MSKTPRLRCAIYTRKSTEEGLDQDFNSLDAQREACKAFIVSQTGLGWKLIPDHYDDGGISGGTMERPALQRMLDDIKLGRIDVVVVYKIDRLTRSLMDFARIVDIFDANSVSFVSVTQAFNTTTSMGRLTLNVLLSFAQFEREVTAERIRDKIAASKKKGMWMGGTVPLGYRVENRKLLVNEDEAKTVRFLFQRYTELKSVALLSEDAARLNLVMRQARRRDSTIHVTRSFGRGNLYHMLANPIYIGKIRHFKEIHDGQHEAIIADDLFETVQALLAEQAPSRSQDINFESSHILTGILYDETGDRLSPSHANKKGKRYRYYVSNRLLVKRKAKDKETNAWRVPAAELELIVENEITQILANSSQLMDWTRSWCTADKLQQLLGSADKHRSAWRDRSPIEKRAILRKLFRSITLKSNWIRYELDRASLSKWLFEDASIDLSDHHPEEIEILERPISMRRRGAGIRMVLTNGQNPSRTPDPALVDLVVRASSFLASLTAGSGKSMAQIAADHATDPSEVSRLLPFAFLAPNMIEMILTGSQPVELNAQYLSRITDLPHLWAEQSEQLGI